MDNALPDKLTVASDSRLHRAGGGNETKKIYEEKEIETALVSYLNLVHLFAHTSCAIQLKKELKKKLCNGFE